VHLLVSAHDHLDALPEPDLVSFQGTVTDPLADLLVADEVVADEVPRSATFHGPWPTEYRIRASHEDRLSAPRRRVNAALRERVERSVLADCEQVLALSRCMAGKLREVHASARAPIPDPGIVPGGVDADRYRPDAGEYAPMQSDGERGDRPRTSPLEADGGDATAFLTVRRLSPRMGHGICSSGRSPPSPRTARPSTSSSRATARSAGSWRRRRPTSESPTG
jgi:hypothetical protein